MVLGRERLVVKHSPKRILGLRRIWCIWPACFGQPNAVDPIIDSDADRWSEQDHPRARRSSSIASNNMVSLSKAWWIGIDDARPSCRIGIRLSGYQIVAKSS